MAAQPTVLPSKDEKRFREILKLYETKHYRKGVKAAEKLLKDHPTHAGTLCMKGLLLAHEKSPERCDEAYQLCKEAIRLDIRNHICWHVFGLLYKLDRNYSEAIKCYATALRMNPEHQQVMRDLALLQIQARDIEGFLSTRQQLLTAKPNMKQHWIGLAVAHHLAGNHDMALIVLEQYRNVTSDQRDADEDEVYESSEMIMYRARIFEDAGRLDEALALLSDASEGVQVVDRVGLLEARASLLLRMGDRDAAEKAHRVLIELNPDNYKYHEGLRAALGLDGGGASTSDLTALYDDLSARFPRSNACKRIPLDFLSGDAFEAAVRKYAAPYLDKGIPSLYAALRPLFADPAKRAVLSALAEEWARDAASAPPDRRSWALCFLAQARREAGDVDGALEAAEQAVEAAQGADPDVLVVKADILEAAGDCHRAADIADEARCMDLADRYLNCAAVKLMFRAGQVLRGEACAGLFTKDGNGVNNLYNMQATWYERAAARGHFRRGEYALGLKKIMSVFRHFGDFVEDQYDFHMYCMRKMTLRAYIDMLETEDRIYSHPAFEEAALIAVEALLEVSQRPELRKSPEEIEEAKLAGMSKAERKEYKRQKAEEEEARRKVAAKGEKTAQASWGPRDKPDTDPTGQRWLHTHEPLEEAAALVDKLRQFCTSSPSTHVAAFDVHMARGKRLLCLAAVRALERCGGAGHPSLPRMVAQLSGAAGATANGGDGGAGEEAVASALRKGLEDVLGGKGVGAWVEEWAREHGGESIEHAMGAAKARVVLGTSVVDALKPVVEGTWVAEARGTDEARLEAIHRELSRATSLVYHEVSAAVIAAKCKERFPRSAYFGGASAMPEPEVVPEVVGPKGPPPPI